jgi:hypothetical protein
MFQYVDQSRLFCGTSSSLGIPTIDQLFDIIQEASTPFALHVAYDPIRYFPMEVTFDYGEFLASEEYNVSVYGVVLHSAASHPFSKSRQGSTSRGAGTINPILLLSLAKQTGEILSMGAAWHVILSTFMFLRLVELSHDDARAVVSKYFLFYTNDGCFFHPFFAYC